MSSPQKQQVGEGEIEPQSPSQIFKIESETKPNDKQSNDERNSPQQIKDESQTTQQQNGQMDQLPVPEGLLTAKKQNSFQGAGEFNAGRWSTEEHNLFLEALRLFGKNWDKIQKHVKTRNVCNIRSHSQKFNQKLEKIVDKQGNLLPGVDWDKQVQAGVDEHGSAPYYFKLLMKRTKKDALKQASAQKMTPTNDSSSRPRFESYTESNFSAPANQTGNGSSADSQDAEVEMNKSQQSQNKKRNPEPEDMMEMEFNEASNNNGIVNFSADPRQNQTDQGLENLNNGNRIIHDGTRQRNQGHGNQGDSEMIKVVDRNSFREHYKNKMNEVLSIDNRTKMTDAEIANYTDYFFDVLEQRDAGQSQPKKESFKTNSDFVQANLRNNGVYSLDERLKGSRFNFQQQQDIKQEFLKYQQLEQIDFCNQMNMDVNTMGGAQQAPVDDTANNQSHIMDFSSNQIPQQESNNAHQAYTDYMNYNNGQQQNVPNNNNFVDTFMGQGPAAPDNNVAMDVADDVTMQTVIM